MEKKTQLHHASKSYPLSPPFTENRSTMSTNSDKRVVYFTSALSDRLNAENDGKAHEGLYKCNLNIASGSCEEPQLVADHFHHDHETRQGLRLSHLSIDGSNEPMMYATYFENNSRGFEIVRGSLSPKVQLESFFRTKGVYSSRTCNKECCPGAQHTYLVTKPASYLLDAGEVLISWAGYYRVSWSCPEHSINQSCNFSTLIICLPELRLQ